MDSELELERIRFDHAKRADASPYIEHDKLLHECRKRRPRRRTSTVTSFTNWLFEVMHPHLDEAARAQAMAAGAAGHAQIASSYKLQFPPRRSPPGWQLRFVDYSDGTAQRFTISRLLVNGQPLTGTPDAVLQSNSTGTILIIERKTTTSPNIPAEGWPNLKAQLWCYSWIDEFASAPDTLLAGEIWQRTPVSFGLSRRHPQWRRSDSKFDRECRELFEAWGGTISENAPLKPRARWANFRADGRE